MAFVQRFSTIERGGIRFIGNTLGLNKSSNTLSAGTLGSIGAFTSLNNTQFSNFPIGTTSNYLENGSNATLQLPIGSTVLYAELIWGGLYRSQTQNISNLIDNAVTFTANGTNFSISPDGLTSQTFVIPSGSGYDLGFYVRTANVTNIVANSLNGTYSTGGVPALIIANDNQTNQTNHAGWTLAIVYHNDNEIIRNLTLWVGGAVVGPNTPVSDTTLTGFITPAVSVGGKVFMSAQEGDAVLTGDQFLFGRDTLSLKTITFKVQITGDNMIITNQSGVTFLSVLPGGETVPGSQDSNIVTTEVISTTFSKVKSTADDFIREGENTTQSITLTNNSSFVLKNLFFNDTLAAGASHVAGSVIIDGVSYPAYDLITGFNLPDLQQGDSTTIFYTLLADNPKTQDTVDNFATVNYSVDTPQGTRNFTENTNTVTFAVISTRLDVVKSVDKTVAISGEILNYTSVITNTGSQTATNLVFSDILQAGLTFVTDSVRIDNVSFPGYNPISSFSLPNLNPGQSVRVDFQARVI